MRRSFLTLTLCATLVPSTLSFAQTAIDDSVMSAPIHTISHRPVQRDTRDLAPEVHRGTDRFSTVGRHRFQVETSFDYQAERDTAANINQYSLPTRLRFGITRNIEVNVQGSLFTAQSVSTGTDNNGVGDLTLGSKWSVAEGGGLLPSLGVAASLQLPTGSNAVSSNTLTPGGEAILSWDLPAEVELDSNIGMNYPQRDAAGDRYAHLTYGIAAERALPIANERANAFLEFAGSAALKNGKSGPHQFGTGLGFALRDNMRLDSFARVGLNDTAPNFQTGLGFTWRAGR